MSMGVKSVWLGRAVWGIKADLFEIVRLRVLHHPLTGHTPKHLTHCRGYGKQHENLCASPLRPNGHQSEGTMSKRRCFSFFLLFSSTELKLILPRALCAQCRGHSSAFLKLCSLCYRWLCLLVLCNNCLRSLLTLRQDKKKKKRERKKNKNGIPRLFLGRRQAAVSMTAAGKLWALGHFCRNVMWKCLHVSALAHGVKCYLPPGMRSALCSNKTYHMILTASKKSPHVSRVAQALCSKLLKNAIYVPLLTLQTQSLS